MASRSFTLVMTAPGTIGDPITYGAALTGKEWANQGEDSLYSVTAIGASTARTILNYQETGLATLQRIAKTYQRLGRSSVKRLFTVGGGSDYFVETLDGAVWNTYDGNRVDARTQQDMRVTYARMRKINNDPALLKRLETAWDSLLGGSDEARRTRPPGTARLEDFALADGSLNVKKAVADLVRVQAKPSVTRDNGGVRTQAETFSVGACFWFVCDHLHTGDMRNDRAYVAGGFAQSNTEYIDRFVQDGAGNWQPQYLPPFYVRSGVDRAGFETINSPLGCAPASFTSLVWWHWRYGGSNWYGTPYSSVTDPRPETPWNPKYDQPRYWVSGMNNGDVNSGSINYNRPYLPDSPVTKMVRARPDLGDGPNEPLITARMGGFFFVNGTLVTPNGYVAGANWWLQQQRSSGFISQNLRVRGFFWYGMPLFPSPFVGEQGIGDTVFPMAAVLRDKVGMINILNGQPTRYAEEAVVALFPTPLVSSLQAHYAVVLRYRIVYRLGGIVDVLVKTTDHANWNLGWTTISSTWATAKGTFDIVAN